MDAKRGDDLIDELDGAPVELLVPATDEARAFPLAGPDELDRYVRRDLRKEENAIARKFAAQSTVTWPYTAVALACFAAWVAFLPLAIAGVLPLWLGCVLASIFVAGGYVVAHEAMHSNLGAEGTSQRFWNEVTGIIATAPLLLPFSMVKLMHLLHHKHTNDPHLDPDAIHAAPNVAMAVVQSWLNRQPGKGGTAARWKRHCTELGTAEARRALGELMVYQLVTLAALFALAWSGYAIEAALLIWLPRHIGLSYIHAVLSWAPHHPHGGTGRYRDTAIIRHKLGLWGAMGIDYHLVHHLYPFIPVHATGAAYRELKPILALRGVDVSAH